MRSFGDGTSHDQQVQQANRQAEFVVRLATVQQAGPVRSTWYAAPCGRYVLRHRRSTTHPYGEESVRLLPREEEFFDLFVEVAKRNVEAANRLHDLFEAPPERRAPIVEAIKRLEHECDDVTHEVVNRLDRTFITPLDREDIHQFASDLDDVMDAIDGTARRAQIFRIGVAPAGIRHLTEVIQRMVAVLGEAVSRLKKGDDIMKYCVQAKQLEEEGDVIYHEMLGQLFDKERDAVEIIKWKEIYDNLERTLDEAEDVANMVESITLKHA